MTLYPLDKHEYFIGATTCTDAEMQKAFTEHPPETDFNKWGTFPTNFKSTGPDVHYLMWQINIIKPEFEDKGHFWWRSMLTYYVTRPNFKLREAIIKSAMVTTPCISIHVRHSDKVIEAALLDFSKYMEAATLYKSKTGISNIYLMTDDPGVISASKSSGYRDFQFHYLDLPRSNRGWNVDAQNGVSLDSQEKNFLVDVYSAAQCQHIIVTYSSNVGRLIAELAYATRNTVPDVASLDTEWVMYP
ncbi:hypothetical protein BGX26_006457 [Mortierella sp. AD094]|nr:hypothetical protein BGX26_006457 [Mortierella sp. AD094]